MVFVKGHQRQRNTGTKKESSKVTRTQKEIMNAMHWLRYPATVNDIAAQAGMSWVTVKANLKILKGYGLVKFNLKKTEKGERVYWYINYDVFK